MTNSRQFVESINESLQNIAAFLDVEPEDLEVDCIDLSYEGKDPSTPGILPSDEIELWVPLTEGNGLKLTYGGLNDFFYELKNARLINLAECVTPKRLLVRIDSTIHGYETEVAIRKLLNLSPIHSAIVDGTQYNLQLVKETTLFGFLIWKKGAWVKGFEAVVPDDLFIEVLWDKHHSVDVARGLSESLLFEIASSYGILFRRSPRPSQEELEEWLYFSEDDDAPLETSHMRPLITNNAPLDAIRHYLSGIAVEDYEFQIIGFVKALEHISVTVVKEDMFTTVRSKLSGPIPSPPTDGFISDLIAAIMSHKQKYYKDSESLKFTIQKCCQALALFDVAPRILQEKKVITAESSEIDLKEWLDMFSAMVSATRNQIVHAKLNYQTNGEECPSDQRGELASACRRAAEQAIRWYATKNPATHTNQLR